MNKVLTTYFISILILILSAFASMARYSVGLDILGYTGLGIAVVFAYQFAKAKDIAIKIEYISLTLISLLLALRALFIHFDYIEIVFAVFSLVLCIIYLKKSVEYFKSLKTEREILRYGVPAIYFSIALFALTFLVTPFLPSVKIYTGGVSFIFLLFALTVGIWDYKNRNRIEGRDLLSLLSSFKDPSIYLGTVIFLFTAYAGLNKIEMMPDLYTDKYPQAYQDLVKEVEEGNSEKIDGKFKHELYIENYKKFVERNLKD